MRSGDCDRTRTETHCSADFSADDCGKCKCSIGSFFKFSYSKSKQKEEFLPAVNPSACEEKKSLFSLRFFSKPRFSRKETFGRLESQFKTPSAPAF